MPFGSVTCSKNGISSLFRWWNTSLTSHSPHWCIPCSLIKVQDNKNFILIVLVLNALEMPTGFPFINGHANACHTVSLLHYIIKQKELQYLSTHIHWIKWHEMGWWRRINLWYIWNIPLTCFYHVTTKYFFILTFYHFVKDVNSRCRTLKCQV